MSLVILHKYQLIPWNKSFPHLENKVGLPAVGIEPTHREIRDFESRASANSATPATEREIYNARPLARNLKQQVIFENPISQE